MPKSIGEQMQQLYSQFGDLSGVTIELHKELLALRIENQQATATVFLQGAQLSHYQRNNEAPIIWCSSHCDYQQGKPLRGGIPICWPWFGDLNYNSAMVKQLIPASDSAYPAHGFARNRNWQLASIENIHSGLTRVHLTLTIAADEEPLWPYATSLSLTIDIGASLTVCLRVINNDQQPVSYSAALHSYFAIANIDQVAINGLQGLPYIDCTDNWSEHSQQGTLSIDREIDRIYTSSDSTLTIEDIAEQRALSVQSKGSNTVVVWNPWQQKSSQLTHFSAEDYQHMLCIETARAGTDFVTLNTGEEHQLTVTIDAAKPSQLQ